MGKYSGETQTSLASRIQLKNGGSHILPDGIKVRPVDLCAQPDDLITVVTSVGGKPLGKVIKYSAEKGFHKERAPDRGLYKAKTISVSELTSDLPPVLDSLGSNQALILGFVPGTEDGEEFTIWPGRLLNKKLGIESDQTMSGMFDIPGKGLVCGRFKSNFQASTIRLIDIDVSEEMPSHIRPNNIDHCLEMLHSAMPGLGAAAKVVVPSTSARVTNKGGKSIFPSNSLHIYVQTTKYDNPNRWPTALEPLAIEANLHYEVSAKSRTTGQDIRKLQRYLWDPIPLKGSERLVFEGPPTLANSTRNKGARI